MNNVMLEDKKFFIEKGKHVSFSSGKYKINCVKGSLWITWPGSGDVLLGSGDKISLKTKGVLCLTALSDSTIHTEKKIFISCLKNRAGLFITKKITAVFAYIKNGEHNSVIEDSIHSISR